MADSSGTGQCQKVLKSSPRARHFFGSTSRGLLFWIEKERPRDAGSQKRNVRQPPRIYASVKGAAVETFPVFQSQSISIAVLGTPAGKRRNSGRFSSWLEAAPCIPAAPALPLRAGPLSPLMNGRFRPPSRPSSEFPADTDIQARPSTGAGRLPGRLSCG